MRYLLYDFLQVAGGAERLTLTLASNLSPCYVAVSRIYPEVEPLLQGVNVTVTEIGDIKTRWLTRILEAIYNFKFRTKFLKNADSVIYSGFYSPLAVKHQKSGKRIYYCHTIPRFAYDLYDQHRMMCHFSVRWVYVLAMMYLRYEYEKSLHKMDVIIANSENVRKRIKKYTGLDSIVIYPPIETERFRYVSNGGYYLSTARLTKNKRVNLIVQAFCNMPNLQLVVLSGGPELAELRDMAKDAPNIRFEGWQSEGALANWIGRAQAIIYVPVDEDFGMSPVEAMAAGKPVIGVADGGMLETVLPGKTGILVDEPLTPEKLVDAVNQIEQYRDIYQADFCRNQAMRFNKDFFIERIRGVMSD